MVSFPQWHCSCCWVTTLTLRKRQEGWTHWYSIAMHLDKQNQGARRAFSNSPPGRLPLPQQNKRQVFRHRKPPRWEKTRNKTVQRRISAGECSLGWAIPQVSSRGLLTVQSTRNGWISDRDSEQGLLLQPGHRKTRWAWQQGEALAGRKAQGPGRNSALSEKITGDQCNSSVVFMNLSISAGW